MSRTIDDLVPCEDGVWRTEAEKVAWADRRNTWFNAIYRALTICSISAWIIVAMLVIGAFQ